MKLLILGLATLTSMSSCTKKPAISTEAKPSIIGGSVPGSEHPAFYSAVSLSGNGSICSGTILSAELLVTAAHCFKDISNPPTHVYFGPSLTAPSTVKLAVKEWKTYKDTQKFFPNYDIAWVRFEGGLPAGHKPVKIATEKTFRKAGQSLAIGGYGLTKDPSLNPTQTDAGTKLVTEVRLGQFVKDARFSSLLILEPTPGKGNCSGDSGGPAYVEVNGEWQILGVLNGADSRLTPDVKCESGQAIYTLAAAYKSWIEATAGVRLGGGQGEEPALAPVSTEPSNFFDWCTLPIEAEARHTVDVLLILADTQDCRKASQVLSAMEEIDLSYSDIVDLRPLRAFPKLRSLDLKKNESLGTLAPLSRLTELETLNLSFTGISKLTELSGLEKLRKFSASYNQISDLGPLSALKSLEALSIRGNKITTVSPLKNLSSLKSLLLASNPLSDLSALSGLGTLATLDLAQTSLIDLSPIALITTLEELDIGSNAVSSLSPLSGMKKLHTLKAYANEISDLSPLTALKSILKLSIYKNRFIDISPLRGLTELTETDLSENRIGDLSPLSTLKKLTRVEIRDTGLSDITHLSRLPNITYLDLRGNNITEVNSLSGMLSLDSLFLTRNSISDISPLAAIKGLKELRAEKNPIAVKTCPVSPASICKL
jgi:internalin A